MTQDRLNLQLFDPVVGKHNTPAGPHARRLSDLVRTADEMLGKDWYQKWLDEHFLYDPLRDEDEYCGEIAEALELELALAR
jgi:hypothetical protein